MSGIKPTVGSERLQVIDALRGFALFGILLANLLGFMGLYNYSAEEVIAFPKIDGAVLFFIDWFVEGKFYGIFSILFGVGFALQAERFQAGHQHFVAFWYRRMVVLCIIGLTHMYLIWHGDILTLYSVMGLFLPLFITCSNRTLLRWVAVLLITPLVLHFLVLYTQDHPFWSTLRRAVNDLKAHWGFAHLSTLEMRTSSNPVEVFCVNILNAIPRPMAYLQQGRNFKVLGLFLIGILLARHWLPKIRRGEITVPTGAVWLGVIGLILSFGYAWTKAVIGGFKLSGLGIWQAFFYHAGSTTLALGMSMLLLYVWATGRFARVFDNLAILGRMALTNYIFQNTLGVLLFFGYGLGLMGKLPMYLNPLIALTILAIQLIFSRFWLSRFKQGPLEFIWRKLTYKKVIAQD